MQWLFVIIVGILAIFWVIDEISKTPPEKKKGLFASGASSEKPRIYPTLETKIPERYIEEKLIDIGKAKALTYPRENIGLLAWDVEYTKDKDAQKELGEALYDFINQHLCLEKLGIEKGQYSQLRDTLNSAGIKIGYNEDFAQVIPAGYTILEYTPLHFLLARSEQISKDNTFEKVHKTLLKATQKSSSSYSYKLEPLKERRYLLIKHGNKSIPRQIPVLYVMPELTFLLTLEEINSLLEEYICPSSEEQVLNGIDVDKLIDFVPESKVKAVLAKQFNKTIYKLKISTHNVIFDTKNEPWEHILPGGRSMSRGGLGLDKLFLSHLKSDATFYLIERGSQYDDTERIWRESVHKSGSHRHSELR